MPHRSPGFVTSNSHLRFLLADFPLAESGFSKCFSALGVQKKTICLHGWEEPARRCNSARVRGGRCRRKAALSGYHRAKPLVLSSELDLSRVTRLPGRSSPSVRREGATASSSRSRNLTQYTAYFCTSSGEWQYLSSCRGFSKLELELFRARRWKLEDWNLWAHNERQLRPAIS